jgi:hypothetical protein
VIRGRYAYTTWTIDDQWGYITTQEVNTFVVKVVKLSWLSVNMENIEQGQTD